MLNHKKRIISQCEFDKDRTLNEHRLSKRLRPVNTPICSAVGANTGTTGTNAGIKSNKLGTAIFSVEAPSLENVPTEIFCQILSFLGPRSTDLVSLSQVSVRRHKVMNVIGDTMLKRARSVFRGDIQSVQGPESSISTFVRLSRECYNVQRKIHFLNEIVKKNFHTQLPSQQIDASLDFCLELLQKRCSRHQERDIVSLCGKIASKAYKACRQDITKTFVNSVDVQKKACLLMTIVMFRKLKVENFGKVKVEVKR